MMSNDTRNNEYLRNLRTLNTKGRRCHENPQVSSFVFPKIRLIGIGSRVDKIHRISGNDDLFITPFRPENQV